MSHSKRLGFKVAVAIQEDQQQLERLCKKNRQANEHNIIHPMNFS
jgi:hypothetical protein